MTTRTYTPRQSEIERRWFVVDASGQTLGRLATQVATLLSGKHKPVYATHLDTGDHVIVINAARVTVKGDKLTAEVYARHSGYPGGFRSETLAELLERRPEEVVRRAVRGMLPRNRLGAQQLRKLRVYAEADHPHEAQQPSVVADAADALTAAAVATPAAKREKVSAPPHAKEAAAEPARDAEPVATEAVAEPVATEGVAEPAAESDETTAADADAGASAAADADAGASAPDEGESQA
jgi:large subunit ribosomal protein L13